MKTIDKPFYLQPPWKILFEPHKIDKIYPWEIKISFLLSSFLEEMEKRSEIDFRASGIALDSSAILYLMKAKLLLKLEEPPASPKIQLDFIPPPLILPLRYELTTTTIQNLLEALDDTLRSEKIFALKSPLRPILPPPPEIIPTISAYLMEIEKEIKRLYEKMSQMLEKGELITFSKLISSLEKFERIKTFVVLLFMAQNGKVSLWQEEEFGEIFVTLIGG